MSYRFFLISGTTIFPETISYLCVSQTLPPGSLQNQKTCKIKNIPITGGTIPNPGKIDPIASRTIPISEKIIHRAGKTIHISGKIVPIGGEIIHISDGTIYMAGKIIPMSDETIHIVGETVPRTNGCNYLCYYRVENLVAPSAG